MSLRSLETTTSGGPFLLLNKAISKDMSVPPGNLEMSRVPVLLVDDRCLFGGRRKIAFKGYEFLREVLQIIGDAPILSVCGSG